MKYAGIIKNDLAAAPGISVTFFTQGCARHCPGCHNPESWDFNGGKDFSAGIMKDIIEALTANGIARSLSIMGGEPLNPENKFLTALIIDTVKSALPNTKIYVWTGFTIEELKEQEDKDINFILDTIDCLIDGPYKKEERDITLQMRGSRNQRVIYLKGEKSNEM